MKHLLNQNKPEQRKKQSMLFISRRTVIRVQATSLFIVACLCVALGCGRGESDKTAAQSGDADQALPGLVFLGDSLTAGRGLPLEGAMPALIQAEINRAGLKYRVINGGRSGDTTAGGLSRLGWYLRPEVKPAILVIGLGSNDAMRGRSLASIKQNLRAIVRSARKYDPKLKILLFQMHTFPNMGRRYAGSYQRLFAEVARS